MTKYLISFPGSAMDISDEDMAAVGEAAHAVIREAKDAGVYVFGGGINEDVAPLMVAADDTVTNETYPQTKEVLSASTVFIAMNFGQATRPSASLHP